MPPCAHWLPLYGSQAHYVVLAGSVALTVALSSVGLALWEISPYMADVASSGRGNGKPFAAAHVTGLTLFILFCTVAVVTVYVSVSTALHQALTTSQVPIHAAEGDSGDRSLYSQSQPGATCGEAASTTGSDGTRSPPRLLLATALYAGCSLFFVAMGIAACVVWAWDPFCTCGVLFCIGDPAAFPLASTRPPNGLSFNATVGLMTFFTFVPLGLVMAARLFTLRKVIIGRPHDIRDTRVTLNSTSSSGGGAAPRKLPTEASATHNLLVGVIPMATLLIACAIVGFYLPNDTRRFLASKIANLAAIQATYGNNTGMYTAPELPGAWFRTRNIILSQYITLKLFPGNVFFYAYLLLVILGMCLLRLTVLGRVWLRTPVRWLPRRGWSYGDLMLTSLTALLSTLFFIYWLHDHNYKRFWSASMGDSATGYIQASERWGRATGQLAILFLSLLMFPTSRSSSLPLFRAMGLSWNSFLWAHRMLGYAMLLATLAHVIFFLVNFHANGVLWSNLTSLPTLVGKKKVRNDFTIIPVTVATFVVLFSMGVFAFYPLRRRCFELFYHSHLLGSYVLFPTVLWHAAAGWEYLLPGLTLWLLDRFIRLYRSGALVEVVDWRVIDARTCRIDFRCLDNGATVCPGQFVFLNVPEIALLQWHPFTTVATSVVEGVTPTAAGGADDGRLTVFVNAMPGADSWTRQLYNRIASADPAAFATTTSSGGELLTAGVPTGDGASREAKPGDATGSLTSDTPPLTTPVATAAAAAARVTPFTLRIDGPCGSALGRRDMADYACVYFVAGGIGIVPCAALYQSLYDQCHLMQLQQPRRDRLQGQDQFSEQAMEESCARRRSLPRVVRLLWVCRSMELIDAFASVLACTRAYPAADATQQRENSDNPAHSSARSRSDLLDASWVDTTVPLQHDSADAGAGHVDAGGGTTFASSVFLTGASSGYDASPAGSLVATRGRQATMPEAVRMRERQAADENGDISTAFSSPALPTLTSLAVSMDPTLAAAQGSARDGSAPVDEDTRQVAGPYMHSEVPAPPCRTVYVHGRPNWFQELAAAMGEGVAKGGAGVGCQRGGSVLVIACGPSKLTHEVHDVAVSLGATFHREEFNL